MEPRDFASPLEAVVGLSLAGLATVLWRWSSDRRSRTWLGAYLALVGGNHLLVGLVNSAVFLEPAAREALRPALVAAYRVADVLQLLDAPALAIAVAALALGRVPAWLRWSAPAFIAQALALAALTLPGPFGSFNSMLSRPLLAELLAVQLVALGALLRAHARETHAIRRDRLGVLASALGVLVLTRTALLWRDFAAPSDAMVWGMAATAAGLVGAATLCGWAVRRRPRGPGADHTFPRLALGVTAVAALWCLLWFDASLRPLAEGLWYVPRLIVFALFLSAGIHRVALLDVSSRGERWLWASLLATTAASLAVALWAILAGVAGADPVASLPSAIALAVLVTGMVVHLAGSRPSGPPALRRRQVAIYRAHLEMGTGDAELRDLRERLRIAPDEARRLAGEVLQERQVAHAAAAATALAPGATVAGRYRVEELLGMGGFGRTFLALDTLDGGRVVLKELLAARSAGGKPLTRFRREAKAVLAADHPALVRFRDLLPLGAGHVLVLDHVEGPTLRERLRSGPLSPKEARRLAAGLLAGLGHLHGRGIAHGDVKPENIVLRNGRDPVLLDFGAARVLERRTRTEATAGTQGYLAPERSAGVAPTVAADLYAVAAVLWEALTGRLPPDGHPPASWAAVLRTAMARRPRERWKDAAAMAEALPQR